MAPTLTVRVGALPRRSRVLAVVRRARCTLHEQPSRNALCGFPGVEVFPVRYDRIMDTVTNVGGAPAGFEGVALAFV